VSSWIFFDFESEISGSEDNPKVVNKKGEFPKLTLVPFTSKNHAVQTAQRIYYETGIAFDHVVFYKRGAGDGKYVWVPPR